MVTHKWQMVVYADTHFNIYYYTNANQTENQLLFLLPNWKHKAERLGNNPVVVGTTFAFSHNVSLFTFALFVSLKYCIYAEGHMYTPAIIIANSRYRVMAPAGDMYSSEYDGFNLHLKSIMCNESGTSFTVKMAGV